MDYMFLGQKSSAVPSAIIGGGGGCIFIYSCSARRISFESDCFYGTVYEPLPPQKKIITPRNGPAKI